VQAAAQLRLRRGECSEFRGRFLRRFSARGNEELGGGFREGKSAVVRSAR
jgi:hypothetical protein